MGEGFTMNHKFVSLNFNNATNGRNIKGALVAFFLHKRNSAKDFLFFRSKNLATPQAQVIDNWLQKLKQHSLETYDHSLRVAQLTVQLAQTFGVYSKTQLAHIKNGALLHDIGKIAIPQEILTKETTLTLDDRRMIECHPSTAYEWLSPIAFLQPALDIPHYHHERWNGGGYPLGLAGEAIPLTARICAITDYWDALSNTRSYRSAISKTDVLTLIQQQSGKLFDPNITNLFCHMMQKNLVNYNSSNMPVQARLA